jgi:hypothetical protein
MEKKYEPGIPVIYVDPLGIPRSALVTIWHCTMDRGAWLDSQQTNRSIWAQQDPPVEVPIRETCCNLVWVSGDVKRTDSYGQQTIRESSVVHKGSQHAHGNYWIWPDEL